LLDETDFHLTF